MSVRPHLADARHGGMFDRPTSVILCGDRRPLLNWVAYALAVESPGGFVWTDIELEGEVREETDLLRTNRIPRDRYFQIPPEALSTESGARTVSLGTLVQPESPEAARRLLDFLQLPPHAQSVISGLRSDVSPPVLVFSNGQRISGLHSWQTVGPGISAIVESGASLLVTWAEAPTKGRFQFETILHLKGGEPVAWKDALLRVERAAPDGPLQGGDSVRLRDFSLVAATLEKILA